MLTDRLTLPSHLIEDPAAWTPLGHLSLRLKTYRWLLQTLFPQPASRRLLDLGAGPGHFARIASRHGFAVTALDARPPWTLAGAPQGTDGTPPPMSEFIVMQADVRDFEHFSDHDVIACIGLLYHLPLDAQRQLLQRTAGLPLIIDTELYDAARVPPGRASRFTAAHSAEGWSGAWVTELDQVYSAADGDRSFWFDQDSLLRFLAEMGRRRVTVLDPGYSSAFGPRRWYAVDVPG